MHINRIGKDIPHGKCDLRQGVVKVDVFEVTIIHSLIVLSHTTSKCLADFATLLNMDVLKIQLRSPIKLIENKFINKFIYLFCNISIKIEAKGYDVLFESLQFDWIITVNSNKMIGWKHRST